jgi:putative ABC transport system permease protein
MLDIAARQLLTKKLRTVLTIAGFGVCVNLYIVVTTVMRFVSDDLDLQVKRFAGLLMVQSRSEAGMTGIEWPPISSAMPRRSAEQVLRLDGVKRDASSAVTFAALAPPPFPTAPPEALLIGIEQGNEAAFLGDAPAILGSNRLGARRGTDVVCPVVLGILAARHFAPTASEIVEVPSPVGPIPLAAVGSTIVVREHKFEVQGIVEPETNQLLRSCVVVPQAAAQAMLGRAETVSAVLITPERTSDIESLQEKIERDFEDLMVINDKALAENAGLLLQRVTQLFNVVRWTAVAVAALLITIVMFVSVLERTKEIGTLRAIGAPARAVFSMVLAESLVIATLGALMGVPLSRNVIRQALGPDAVGIRSGRIELMAVGLLTSFGLVAALLPAARAVRVDPIVALRYE